MLKNLTRPFEKFSAQSRDFKLFLLANIFLGLGICIDTSTFNNYLHDIYKLGVGERTFLEFPRETPGFLVMLFMTLLFGLGDIRIAAVAMALASLGMFFLGVIPPVYGLMLFCVFIYSAGQHIFMPLGNSIGMSFARDGNYGKKLGQISAANTAALVGGSALLLVVFYFLNLSYLLTFTFGAAFFLAAAICLFMMNPHHIAVSKNRWVFRKEYGLFYWLSFLYGARKQLFLTFGPWVIVDVFKQPLTTMTLLFFIVSILGIWVRPFLGSLIDKIGEKRILAGEALLITLVCFVYIGAADFFSPFWALIVVCAAYITDQTANSVGMARATYLKKIALKPEDVSPTLSLGVSIDHIVSMSLPVFSGMLWVYAGEGGYKYVFLLGAGIALLNFFSTLKIKTK